MPFDLRTTQGRRESPAIHLEARPARGNATNASQPATRPKITRKSTPPPGYVLPANKQVIGRGSALSPEGEVGDSCSRDGHHAGWQVAGDSGGSPQWDVYLHRGTPGSSWHGRSKNPFLTWYKSHLFSLNLSCRTSRLQKLYCDWCQWKASSPFFPCPSHWPIWAVIDFACLSSCASVSYLCPWEGPFGLP